MIVTAVERQSIIAEHDDLWRQVVESGRPVCAQRLGGSDHHFTVVKSLLMPVDSQEADTRPGVGQDGVLMACCSVVDVPLLPERPLAPRSTLAEEPVGR